MSLCNKCGLRFRKLKQKREAQGSEIPISIEEIRKTRKGVTRRESPESSPPEKESDDEVRGKMSMRRILN